MKEGLLGASHTHEFRKKRCSCSTRSRLRCLRCGDVSHHVRVCLIARGITIKRRRCRQAQPSGGANEAHHLRLRLGPVERLPISSDTLRLHGADRHRPRPDAKGQRRHSVSETRCRGMLRRKDASSSRNIRALPVPKRPDWMHPASNTTLHSRPQATVQSSAVKFTMPSFFLEVKDGGLVAQDMFSLPLTAIRIASVTRQREDGNTSLQIWKFCCGCCFGDRDVVLVLELDAPIGWVQWPPASGLAGPVRLSLAVRDVDDYIEAMGIRMLVSRSPSCE